MSDPGIEELIHSLRSTPRAVIHGVVYPFGVVAGKFGGNDLWHLKLSLAAWASPDGLVRRSKVHLRCEVDDEELKSYQNLLPDYGVVTVEVGLSEDPISGDVEVLLYRVVSDSPAREDLLRIADDLRKPVTAEVEQFGVFTLDRATHSYEAQTYWEGKSVRLTLSTETDDETFPQNSLAHAKRLWSDQKRWHTEVRESMVKELLDIKNDFWLEQGEPRIGAEEFLQRTTLESITVTDYGVFDFWYADGDLFWGHAIMVSGSFDGGIDDVGIHG